MNHGVRIIGRCIATIIIGCLIFAYTIYLAIDIFIGEVHDALCPVS